MLLLFFTCIFISYYLIMMPCSLLFFSFTQASSNSSHLSSSTKGPHGIPKIHILRLYCTTWLSADSELKSQFNWRGPRMLRGPWQSTWANRVHLSGWRKLANGTGPSTPSTPKTKLKPGKGTTSILLTQPSSERKRRTESLLRSLWKTRGFIIQRRLVNLNNLKHLKDLIKNY